MPPRKKRIIQASDDSDAFSAPEDTEPAVPTRSAAAPSTRASTSAPTLAAAPSRPQRAAARTSAHATSELSGLPSDEEEDELMDDDEDDGGDADLVLDDDDDEDEEDELLSESEGEDDSSGKGKGKATTKAPTKLKLKLGKAPAKPAALRRVQSQSRRSSAGPSRKAGKKRAAESDGDEDEEDEDSGSDSNQSENSSASLARMTARQRAGALGEGAGEEALLELPTRAPRAKFSGLSTAEADTKRLALIQKRKDQQLKKLEDEKQDTINRLLNKQPGHGKGTGKGRKRKAVGAEPAGEDAAGADGVPKPSAAPAAPPPPDPTLLRYVQSGTATLLSVPISLSHLYVAQPARPYPGPRPPPRSRRLVPAA